MQLKKCFSPWFAHCFPINWYPSSREKLSSKNDVSSFCNFIETWLFRRVIRKVVFWPFSLKELLYQSPEMTLHLYFWPLRLSDVLPIKVLEPVMLQFSWEKTSSQNGLKHSEKPIKKVIREELIAGHLW